jgi:hypothetical protein
MRWRVQLGINNLIVRVMFGNFAKIGRAAGASPIWQISKHHEQHRMITCLLLA